MGARLTSKSPAVRGACPQRLRLRPAERAALERLEAALKQESGLALHPLLWRLPLPHPERDYAAPRKTQLADEGWTAPVAVVLDPETRNRTVLTDAFQLKLWLDSGRKWQDIPESCLDDVAEDDALLWHLLHHIPAVWPKQRRAAAAAAMAAAAHGQLHRLKALTDLHSKSAGVKDVLAAAVQVSPRYIQYALQLLRRRLARFRRTLWGEPKHFSVPWLNQAAAPGSGAGRNNEILIPYGPKIERAPRILLAIVDLNFVSWESVRPDGLARLLDPRGVVVLLGRTVSENAADFLNDLNAAPGGEFAPYKRLGLFNCLERVDKVRGCPASPTFRSALLLGRDLLLLEAEPALKEQLRKRYAQFASQRDLEDPKRLQRSLNRRQARIRTYARLILEHTPRPGHVVFAPCFAGSARTEDRIFLDCMKAAVHRSRRKLMYYDIGSPAFD